jgi:hypothetical protein
MKTGMCMHIPLDVDVITVSERAFNKSIVGKTYQLIICWRELSINQLSERVFNKSIVGKR